MTGKNDYKLDHKLLVDWYLKNRRALPWRQNKDPYRIWLSEVMLQQTTVVAVIPYYERFLNKFPTLQSLADAPEPEVLEAWAGLGYYSRARNLHKAAQALSKIPFPETAAELIQLPGFGPYTSRAVASIAFGEAVGVLDGNVVRVLCRRFGLPLEFWLPKGRDVLQKLSDSLASLGKADLVNQGLMELGATICTPKKTLCLMCPWAQSCVARSQGLVDSLPLKKPRKMSEVWVWQVQLQLEKGKVGLVKNDYAPFLKGQMIFPGKVFKQEDKPKDYISKHSITHHDIFVQISRTKKPLGSEVQWIDIKQLKKVNPSSLLQKVLEKTQSL